MQIWSLWQENIFLSLLIEDVEENIKTEKKQNKAKQTNKEMHWK